METREITLLDTAIWADAISTGRDRNEDVSLGEDGLRITYEFKHGHASIYLNGIDGEIRLSGLSEIQYAAQAIAEGARLAECDLRQKNGADK